MVVPDPPLLPAQYAAADRVRHQFRALEAGQLAAGSGELSTTATVRSRAGHLLGELVRRETEGFAVDDRRAVTRLVLSDVLGLGVVDRLFDDPSVTDVAVNPDGSVWYERNGVLARHRSDLTRAAVARLVDRTAAAIGRRADRRRPVLDGAPRRHVRATIVVPPAVADGPTLAFRRHLPRVASIDSFAGPTTVERLRQLVRTRANLLIVGATGAGKTTLLASLLSEIDPAERIVVVEDTAELPIERASSIRLVAQNHGPEGVGEVNLASLVRASLRLRPDRIVVGEVRGPEAFDMVWALSTGHAGSMSTCHAFDAAGALRRLVAFVLTARPELRVDVATEMVAASIDAIVVVARTGGAVRRVDTVVERGPGSPRTGWESRVGWPGGAS